jgi:glycosyltransferase involved in cell wall biosynthesis
MSSFYAIASRLAGPGIGNTAHRGAIGLWRAGRLGRIVALGHNPTEITADRIIDVWFPPRRALWFLDDKRYYQLKNRRFDAVCRRTLPGDETVVHLWNSQATGAARLAKRLGKKLVIDRASTHIRTQTRLLVDAYAAVGIRYEPTYQETIERCVEEYELADLILTPSPRAVRSFAEEGVDLGKVVECPFGADLERFQPRERPPDRFRALFVGQLGVRKGILTLLEAWDRAQIDGDLLLVGGEEEAIGPRLARWRGRRDIQMLGFRNDVAELTRGASAFVFPSIEEGSALVTYEAMACGLPLIVTEEAGSVAREGMEASLVRPGDADGLAAALTRLAGDHAFAWEMGLAARRRVEQFPWSAYGERVAAAHRLLAAGANLAAVKRALSDARPFA